jgi:succinyl-diaminopimelate desuccinylase
MTLDYSLVELTKKLIHYESITPKDKGCVDFLAEFLANKGFVTYVKTFGDAENLTTNLYAQYGAAKPNICFAGHIDVVPTGPVEKWNYNPFLADEVDGIIYGRGAVDMKGPLAAMIVAAIDLIQNKQFNGSFSFLITSDEEGDAKYGTNTMLEWLTNNLPDFNLDFAVIGEPSCYKQIGDQLAIGRRGSANFDLEVYGKQGHVAFPHEAINPNKILVNLLHELSAVKFDQISNFFELSNLEITSVDVGNNTTNIIPNKATAKFNIRYNPSYNLDKLLNIVKNTIENYTKEYRITYKDSAKPFFNEPNNFIKKFAESIQSEAGLLPVYITSGGTSDARFIIKYCPVLEFGALYKLAHQIDESISVKDLDCLYKIYKNFLSKVL